MFTWGELGLIQICGKNAASIDAIVAACKAIAGHPGVVRLQDFVINTDVIVLSTPEIAGLPYVISGLVAAGGLAAALSTADGLLLAIANALSARHLLQDARPERADDPPAHRGARPACSSSRWRRLRLAATKPGDILAMVGWAFSLAMAGNFPALVMGVWWKRTTATGAVCGMIAGFGLCLFYLVDDPLLPRRRREVLRHDLAAQPGHRRAAGRHRQGDGVAERHGALGRRSRIRWPTRSAGSTSTTSPAGCWGCRSASW